MKKISIIIATVALLMSSVSLAGFGRRNHATVAYIAEQHLSNKARKEIAKIIGGESLMEGAVYADEKRLDIRIRLEEGEFLRYDGRIGLKGPDGKPFTYGAFYFEEEDGSVWATIPHGWGAENDGTYYPVKKGECVWGTEYYTEMLKNRKNLSASIARLEKEAELEKQQSYTDEYFRDKELDVQKAAVEAINPSIKTVITSGDGEGYEAIFGLKEIFGATE